MQTSEIVEMVKAVRARTGAGLMNTKAALETASWDVEAAVKIIESKGLGDGTREVGHAAVFHYNHNNRIVGVVKLGCNTDFVGNMEEFRTLGNELARQVVGAEPATVADLLDQPYVKDTRITIREMVDLLSRKTQENIKVISLHREAA